MTREELAPLLRVSDRGVTLSFRVQPRASKTALGEKYGDSVKISLASPPVDGKANGELCRFLAEKTGLPRSAVLLLKGETSRSKTVLFATEDPGLVLNALCKE